MTSGATDPSSDRPPRVLLWYWGRRGGGARCTYELAKALGARGDVEVHLSLARGSEWFDKTAALGLPLHAVTTYRDRKSALAASLFLPLRAWQLHRYLRANRIDVVLSVMRGPWTTPMLPALGAAGATFISMVHDAVPHEGELAPFAARALRYELKRSANVVVLSAHAREQLMASAAMPRTRIHTAAHGVFTPLLAEGEGRPTDPWPAERPFHVLFAGRIEPYKDVAMLAEAVRMARQSRPMRLTIAGNGPLDLPADLRAAFPDLQIDNRWLSDEALEAHVNAADVVVLPYREASQSGLPAIAYPAGVPVIATPVGGLSEQVRHGETGLIADKTDAASLADAITRLAGDPALYARCAAGARHMAETDLNWATISDVVVDAVRAAAR